MPTRGEMERDAALKQVPVILAKIAESLGVEGFATKEPEHPVWEDLGTLADAAETIAASLALRNEIAKEQVRATMAHAAIVLSTSVAAGGESIEFSDALSAVKAIMDEVRSYE